MNSTSSLSNGIETSVSLDFEDSELDGFAAVGNKVDDAAGKATMIWIDKIPRYFKNSISDLKKMAKEVANGSTKSPLTPSPLHTAKFFQAELNWDISFNAHHAIDQGRQWEAFHCH